MFYDDNITHTIKIKKKKNDIDTRRKQLSSPFEEEEKVSDSTDMQILNQLITLSNNSDRDNGKRDKKKKKKDKKKSKTDEKKLKNKEKKKSKHMLEVFDDIFDEDDSPKKEKKKKSRQSDDFYEKRFRGSLMLLKGLMQEVNETAIESKEHIRQLKSSPARGSAMAIANQSGTVSTLLNTKLSIIKEITMVNKAISDLELKNESQKMKTKSDAEKSKDSSAYLDDMFEKIMNNEIPLPEYEEDAISKYSLSRESLSDRVDNLINDGTLEFTDSEKAFKYEAMGGVEIAILYDTSSKKRKKWEFVALSVDGEELADYPLPSKRSCGKMEFDLDNDSAKDKLGNIYRLIYINDGISSGDDEYYDESDEDYE